MDMASVSHSAPSTGTGTAEGWPDWVDLGVWLQDGLPALRWSSMQVLTMLDIDQLC